MAKKIQDFVWDFFGMYNAEKWSLTYLRRHERIIMERKSLKKEKTRKMDVILYAMCAVFWGWLGMVNYQDENAVVGIIYSLIALSWVAVSVVSYAKYKAGK